MGVKEEEPSAQRGGLSWLTSYMVSRYSFSDGEGLTRNGSYVRCAFYVLKPTPPLPTQPSVSATLSARMVMASGSITTTPATPTKGGSTSKSRIGSIRKWCVRRQRGSNSTASEVIGTFLHFRFFSRHNIRGRQYPAHAYALVFFELPVALTAQVILPCVLGQGDGIAPVTNRGARVEVGCANVVEIEMSETPTSGRKDRRHRHLP